MRQSRGRGSKVETEARPREAEPRPSQLKKLPRGRLEPRQMPRGLHDYIPDLQYANSAWNPHRLGLIKYLEKVHLRATKLVTNLPY